DRQVDAVGRGTIDREAAASVLVHAQGAMERERVADGALLAIRRDHDDFTEPAHRAGQRREALGLDPIVVTDEDERRDRHPRRAQGATKAAALQLFAAARAATSRGEPI